MKKLLLITTPLLLSGVALANDNYESAGAGSQFIFEMDKDTVFAALLEGGSEGYGRGNLTFAAQGSAQHWFKFSGEYLIEHQDIDFSVDPRQIWADQYAGGATYQFFPKVEWPFAVLANTYGSYTPSQDVNEYQRISEAVAYGGNVGMDVYFPTRTQVEALLRYDVVNFHNAFTADQTEQGLGGSGSVKQYFGCNWNLVGGADFTAIYNNYYSAVNVLFPIGSQAFQLGLKGQYNDPHDNLTRSLIGMVTFGLQPLQPCDTEVTQKRETLSSFASRPAVYMPTVLAKLDQGIVLEGNTIVVFIPDFTFTGFPTTYDVSGYFAGFGPGPLTYSYSGTLPNSPNNTISFNTTTAVFTYSGNFTGIFSYPNISVTATNSLGQTVTSNLFTLGEDFP